MVPRPRPWRASPGPACGALALLAALALPTVSAALVLPPAGTVLQGGGIEVPVQVTLEAPAPYAVGDLLYLDADGSGTTTPGDAAVRGSALAAPVLPSDALFGHAHAGPALGEFAFVDLDDDGRLGAGDAVYACACKPLVAVGDLRLSRPAGAVGLQVRPGNPDLPPPGLPVENAGGTARFGGNWASAIKRVDAGKEQSVLDDCFYLDQALLEGNPRPAFVAVGDVRLTPCMGRAAGTPVAPSDTAELRPPVPSPSGVSIRYRDADEDGRYGVGDALYATTGSEGLAVTAPDWALRLTPVAGRLAGTLVLAGDPELQLPTEPLGGATLGFSNPDASTEQGLDSFTPGDVAYLAPHAVDPGAPFPAASVRLTGAFGSQVQPGAPDFWRPLRRIDGRLVFHDADGVGEFSRGDTLYLRPLSLEVIRFAVARQQAQERVEPGFLRLSPFGALGAGTFVAASDGDVNRTALAYPAAWAYHKPLRCLGASGVGAGVTVTFRPICTAASRTHTMAVATNATTPPGSHTLWVHEDGGTFQRLAWTFTVRPNVTPTQAPPTSSIPTQTGSISSAPTDGTLTRGSEGHLFTEAIELLSPLWDPVLLASGTAGAMLMAATTRLSARGRQEEPQDRKEGKKDEEREDDAPCALLHALQVTPDALEVQEETLKGGAWHRKAPPPEPSVAAHRPGQAPWRRTAVAPGAVLLELDSGEGGQAASVELGGLELTRQLRLAYGQGDCTHAFRAEAGLALTAALHAEGLDGVLEVHVAVQADLQVATDSEPGSTLTDFLHARCHLVDRPVRLEGRGGTRAWSLPDLSHGGIAQGTPLRTLLPASHAELLARVEALSPTTPSFQWRDAATGRFRESVTLAMGVQTARISVRLVEGRVGRVRCALLLAALDLPFEDLECPPLKYPAWLDAAKDKVERMDKARAFLLEAAPRSRAAQALALLDSRLAAAGGVAGKAIESADRVGARRLGAVGWVAVSLLLATLGFAGVSLDEPPVPDWVFGALAGGGLYGLVGRVWRSGRANRG